VKSTISDDRARNIVESIKEKIDRCLIAIFDITNIFMIRNGNGESKAYPNPNVVFEMSYALERKNNGQIILVKKKRKDFESDRAPFDFLLNRYMGYKTKEDARNKLKQAVAEILHNLGFIA
jgi:predicted nucleotide-binding protein